MVDPLTVNVPVKEDVARKEFPETVRAVAEALAKVDWLVTVSWVMVVVAKLEVAETAKPEAAVKVKLVEVAMGLEPLPNSTSLAVKAETPVPPLATDS